MENQVLQPAEKQPPVQPRRGGIILTFGIVGIALILAIILGFVFGLAVFPIPVVNPVYECGLSNTFGLVGIVTALTVMLGFIFGCKALILGFCGLRDMRRGRKDSRGNWKTKAGFVCGIITLSLLIVALLIVLPILLPAFASGRDKARRDICLNNMRQISAAFHMYASDWNGIYPPKERWIDCIMLYLKNEKYLRCPNDRSTARSSYGMNPAFSIDNPEDFADSDTILIFETKQPGNAPFGNDHAVVNPGRHMCGNNYGFFGNRARYFQWGQEIPPFYY